MDRVVDIGDEAVADPVPGKAGTIDTWAIDEPSARGIGGEERMRLIRDDLDQRFRRLASELAVASAI